MAKGKVKIKANGREFDGDIVYLEIGDIDGKYIPAIYYPNDLARPPEYPFIYFDKLIIETNEVESYDKIENISVEIEEIFDSGEEELYNGFDFIEETTILTYYYDFNSNVFVIEVTQNDTN